VSRKPILTLWCRAIVVGISDGNGGFYSSSVGGAIGHGGNKNFFVNYLGWSNAQVPA